MESPIQILSTKSDSPKLDRVLIGAGRRGGPEKRSSLRTELLFNLAFLAAAALLLALWTAALFQLPGVGEERRLWLLVLLVGIDVAAFVLLGKHLIDRLVVHPLSAAAEAAEAIARGEYDRRLPPGATQETAALASAVNHLTEQLLKNQDRLAENLQSLGAVNRALRQTQRELIQAEKLASIGRLAAGVAHEIGNPLAALIAYVALLSRRGGDAELLGGMEREARRIDRIVRGLLEYARPLSEARAVTDVNASLERALTLLRSQGKLHGVDVTMEFAPDLAPISAAPHPLDQLFVNLLANADAATPDGGKLLLRTCNIREAGAGVADGDVVHVTIADSGPGVLAEHQKMVFDPFFTTKAPGEGMGLGLAIVASTVADFGGHVQLSSTPGGGATFTLTFPAVEAQS